MEKESIKKLLYSFLKGKEYLNKTVISQNLSIIDEITEQTKEVKLIGVKNTSDIDRSLIKKLTDSKNFFWHTIDKMSGNGRALDTELINPLTGRSMTGSSSGTAINIFLGINDLGIGTDGGGSVIYPAVSLNLYSFLGSGIGLKSEKMKKSTDGIDFSAGIGLISRDLETLYSAVTLLSNIKNEKISCRIAVLDNLEKDLKIKNIFDKSFISNDFDSDDRMDIINKLSKIFSKYDLLVAKEEMIDFNSYGDSIIGNLGEKAKKSQLDSNKKLGKVLNMMNLSAITVPADEISSAYIIIAKTGTDHIDTLFKTARILEHKENPLIQKYFNSFLENKNIIFQL